MNRLWIDIETYSATPISAGVYRYVEDPHFRILMASWSTDKGATVHRVEDPAGILEIPGLTDPLVVKVAHNAAFERICFSAALGLPRGEYLPPEEWHDTMAVAAEHGYPQGLGPLAIVLGVQQEKDEAGSALIRKFCVPNRKGERNLPEAFPEDWEGFGEYCDQDVRTLAAVDEALVDFPTETERQVYLADQRINDRGLRIDVQLAHRAVDAGEYNRMTQELEMMALTGVQNPGSTQQLQAWLQGVGVQLPDLRAETVRRALEGRLEDAPRRVLELRQELALTSAKKFSSALDAVCSDGRIRGVFRFFGAHTGRWAGRGVQPQNLPRAQLESEAATDAAILDLLLGHETDTETLKALVRALFVGPFTVVDYSAIEARVIAWLAGETWVLDSFRAGRDIYVETAERMGAGMTRTQGKIAVLALGYNGGPNSLQIMGKAYGMDIPTEEAQVVVNQWRRANPRIVSLWKQLEAVFMSGGQAGEYLRVEKDGRTRRIVLPSGRAVTYHDVRRTMTEGTYGPTSRISFADPKRPGRVDTYGGRLTENATQAVARDLLAEALVRLQEAGYAVAGHVHDEIIVEGSETVEDVTRVMCTSPGWADGLPIGGEGFTCKRYRKG